MLDITDTTTTTSSPAASRQAEYTEEQMRTLADAKPRRSVRALAEISGWSKSSVARFLSQIDSEASGTAAGQGDCPTPILPAAAPVVEPEEERFDWSADGPDLVVPHQPALAIYPNAFRQIVIRAENTDYDLGGCSEDKFITINPHHLPAVISKLQAVADEIGHEAK